MDNPQPVYSPLVLGTPFDAAVPENSHAGHTIVVRDGTSPGTWSGPTVDYGVGAAGPKQLADTVWSAKYAALFYFNRSPWVEHDYAGPVTDVRLLAPGDPIPAGAWVLELLDTSDQPGALGYHEGQARVSKQGPSGVHSERGVAIHPATGEEIVVMKAFVKTTREDNVPATEVVTHELFEAAVDPYVNNETEIRVYKNPADGKEYIGEVGDPVQERPWDVGAPEGRPCGVPEGRISDLAYPAWWGQQQSRPFTSLAEEFGLAPRLEPFVLAPGGYMSVREPGGEWTQIYGAAHANAVANAHAFEGPDDKGSSASSPSAEQTEGHVSNRQLLELLHNIDQRTSNMEDVLTGIAADEAALATIVPKLIERDEQASKKLAEFEAKSAAGEVVPRAEVETLKAGFDKSVASLKTLLPAEPAAAAAPDKTVYLHTGTGEIDTSWTTSGFETVPEPEVPAVPADPATGAAEVPAVPAKAAEPLYYFSGDTGPGTSNGTNAEWTPFTGAVQAVPAA